jgi:hypothetical protein
MNPVFEEILLRRLTIIGLFILVTLIGFAAVRADDQTYTGTLDNRNPSFTVTFDLDKGASVYIAADATSGEWDTYLSLENAAGVIVAENDDRDYEQLNSALGYTARFAGAYTVTLTRFDEDESGDYRLNIVVGDVNVLDDLDTQANEISLSGAQLKLDTAHFRIHYTLHGIDTVSEDYVYQVAKTLEEVWRKQVTELGWPAPPTDRRDGGDDRMDIYLMDMLDDEGSGIMGAARPGYQYGDNPNTAAIEHYASSSLLRLDNDFEELDYEGEPLDLMRATVAHEFHHAVQHGYDIDDFAIFAEATSVWMETQTFPKAQDATGYVDYTYRYPELCFGTESDPDEGLMMYGEWLFMQSLVDAHGQKVMFKLWGNIAEYDGFEALEQTLDFFNDNIPNALARYHIQNIARDYKFAPQFDGATLWMSDSITNRGRIKGYGVQELGANYFDFNLSEGTYRVDLVDAGALELWAVGIAGDEASVIPLGRGGVISNEGYEYVYLMVFNPAYSDDLESCAFANYNLDVSPVSAPLAAIAQTWNAEYFLPLTSEQE